MLAFLVFGPMLGALLCFISGMKNEKFRDILAILFTVAEVLLLLYAGSLFLSTGKEIVTSLPGICQMGMNFKLDGFRLLYGFVAAFMWMMTTVFSPEYFAHHHNTNRYYFFVLMTMGATVGVFLSGDLFTTFICFEIMSFTSYAWVAQEENKEALRASETYLAVAVIGGMVMLMGIFLLYYNVNTLDIDKLYEACIGANKASLYAASACMLVGFGAKAGMFPLHIWLPKAHPVAPAPSSALLSGILTKSGIFGVLVISTQILRHDENGGYIILSLGVITMFLGAFIALFSINLKRTLACSSMSQIGFILVGIGMQCLLGEENALAVRGTVLHMVNHSMIKLILFMAAGVVYFNIHKLTLNEIRGFGRGKILLTACFATGALSISGFPLFSGYVSKTLLHESIVEYSEIIEHTSMYGIIHAIEWIFLLTGGMTFAYMLKLFVCVFVEKNLDENLRIKMAEKKKYMAPHTGFALVLPSVMLFIMGILPYDVMNKMAHIALPFMAGEEPEEIVHYFSGGNLKGGCISLSIGLVIYLFFIRICLMKKTENGKEYINVWPQWLDLENMIYRPLILGIIPFIMAFVLRCFDKIADFIIKLNMKFILNPVDEPVKIPYKKNIIDFGDKVLEVKKSVTLTSRVAAKSVSYGLLTFSIGFLITLIYLLYRLKTMGM